jgi:hypothetical protein
VNTQNDVTQRRAQPGVALWRWVRALHAWIIGIGWTDLGTAFALIVVGNICLDDGHAWRGLWCWGLGLTIYFKAPRPNIPVRHGGANNRKL